MVNLLAGIPSVVYGFFGLTVFVPLLRQLTGHDGSTMLTASVLLGIMILPTVTGVAEPALKSAPTSYYEGALALGATHEKSVFVTVFPAAISGVLAGVVLGIGRAIGETMAVIMVAGNQTWMPQGLFKGLRTMTANIVIEMGYATDLHREALIATGVVLFVFILIINLCVSALKRRTEDEKKQIFLLEKSSGFSCASASGVVVSSDHGGSYGIPGRIYSDKRCRKSETGAVCTGI